MQSVKVNVHLLHELHAANDLAARLHTRTIKREGDLEAAPGRFRKRNLLRRGTS
jgi:hypothetical protein